MKNLAPHETYFRAGLHPRARLPKTGTVGQVARAHMRSKQKLKNN